LAAELAGRDTAEAIQLAIEYAAAPPYDVGRPDTASPAVRARVATLGPRVCGLAAGGKPP
jgi:hypothetical protein